MKRIVLLLLVFILTMPIFGMAAETGTPTAELKGSSFRIRYTATFRNVDSSMDSKGVKECGT